MKASMADIEMHFRNYFVNLHRIGCVASKLLIQSGLTRTIQDIMQIPNLASDSEWLFKTLTTRNISGFQNQILQKMNKKW